MVSVTLFGPIDTILGPYMEYILLILVFLNLFTRKVANDTYKEQASNGAEAIERYRPHLLTNWALIIGSFYFMTLHQHAGMVLSVLVLGMFISDFFEFESRKVEAREGRQLELPKSSIVVSMLVFLYTAYIALFFIIKPYWNAVV
ncbi:MAG: hypothetical protein ABEI06_03765 [Halobacteriaceae archaeon]